MSNINNVSPRIIINSYYNSFTNGEKKIANYVLENIFQIEKFTITDIANGSNVSESSVLRFIRKIGYEGFKEFKIYCSVFESQVSSVEHFDEFSNKNYEFTDILATTIQSNINNLKIIPDFIDINSFKKIGDSIVNFDEVYIVGGGYSSLLAKYLFHLLASSGKNLILATNTFELSQAVYTLSKNSFVLVISQKGLQKEFQKFITNVKSKGGKTGCITRIARNPLAEIVHYPVVINSLTNKESSNYLLTQVSFTVVINALFMYVALELEKKDPDYSTEYLDGFKNLYDIFSE